MNDMTGRIGMLSREKVVPRHDVRFPTAWIGGSGAQVPRADGTWLARRLARPPVSPSEPTLVMLGDDRETLQDELLGLPHATRVYAIVEARTGDAPAERWLSKLPKVLVRRVREIPTTAIHAGGEGRLMIGGGLALRLDEAQSRALRQVFLRLFWHEAEREAWSTKGKLEWREALERPFDVPHLLSTSPVRLEDADAKLTGMMSGAKVHLGAGEPPSDAPAKLWFSAGPDHHSALQGLVSRGSAVVWSASGLPDIRVGHEEEGEVLLPNRGGRLRIRLTREQCRELSVILDSGGTWRFDLNVRLGDERYRAAEIWLPGQEAAGRLASEADVPMPPMNAASLSEMATTAPESLASPPPLALLAHYKWDVVPPRPPVGHQEDGLYHRWRKVDENWAKRLVEVRNRLQQAETQRTRIGNMFQSLLGGVLGFAQTHGGLFGRLSALEAEKPSTAGPIRSSELLRELEGIEAEASAHRQDLDDAEAKAQQDKERDEQRSDWEQRRQTAQRKLPNEEANLREKQQALEQFEKQLYDVDGSLKSADKTTREDLQVKKRKLFDEIKSTKEQVGRIKSKIEGLNAQASEEFEFKSTSLAPIGSNSQRAKFVPRQSGGKQDVAVPDEALPETGVLRRLNGQRYLVIDRWDQLNEGQKAADRLSAKLVASEEP